VRHRHSNRIRQRQLLVVRATQKPPDHFEALIIEFQLLAKYEPLTSK